MLADRSSTNERGGLHTRTYETKRNNNINAPLCIPSALSFSTSYTDIAKEQAALLRHTHTHI